MAKKFLSKNISVEWKFDLNKVLRDNFSNRQWANLTQYIVDQNILKKIERGISPVKGEGNFTKYKNPKQYPARLKQSNKPNLTLTGNMLSHYEAKESNELMAITLGLHKGTPKEELIKAKANNEGTQGQLVKMLGQTVKNKKRKNEIKQSSKGIPARPFIPLLGQTYTADIILEIRKAFAYCLDMAIKKGRNK